MSEIKGEGDNPNSPKDDPNPGGLKKGDPPGGIAADFDDTRGAKGTTPSGETGTNDYRESGEGSGSVADATANDAETSTRPRSS